MSDWMARRAEMTKIVEQHLIRYGGGPFPDYFVERAAGSYVYDDAGRRILDFTSGQMCSTLGHNHPDVVGAGRLRGRVDLVRRRGDRPAARLLSASPGLVRGPWHAGDPGRGPDSVRAGRRPLRVRAGRDRPGLPRPVEDPGGRPAAGGD